MAQNTFKGDLNKLKNKIWNSTPPRLKVVILVIFIVLTVLKFFSSAHVHTNPIVNINNQSGGTTVEQLTIAPQIYQNSPGAFQLIGNNNIIYQKEMPKLREIGNREIKKNSDGTFTTFITIEVTPYAGKLKIGLKSNHMLPPPREGFIGPVSTYMLDDPLNYRAVISNPSGQYSIRVNTKIIERIYLGYVFD